MIIDISADAGELGTKAAHFVSVKLMEAIGRNPEAFGRILPAMLVGMAFAEAIAIYSLIFAFLK